MLDFDSTTFNLVALVGALLLALLGLLVLAKQNAHVADFYRRVLGLTLLEEEAGTETLGTGSVPLIALRGDPALAPRDPHAAGLFHTAFLLPSRADLARWLAFSRDAGVRPS